MTGSVYEEEDFQPMTYGFALASDVSEARAGGMLREVEDDLQKTIRASKPLPTGDSKDGEDMEARAQLHQQATALCARIKFLRLFYLGLGALHRVDTQDGVK